MTNIDFYPFDKELSALHVNDLQVLKTIPENWFVEYKVRMIERVKLAKEICSFANQNGGYIFIGIGEKNDKVRTAEKFIGITPEQIQNAIDTIELVATTDCQPPVALTINTIAGKNNTLSMPEENFIILITVKKGENTPHFHSSGVIYQRKADKSEPLKDQYELLNLVKRKEKYQKRIKKTLTRKVNLDKFSKKLPFAFINLLPTEEINIPMNIEKLHEVIKESQKGGIATPFDKFNYIDGGMSFYQRIGNNPTGPSLSFNLFYDGSARFDIPFNKYCLNNSAYPQNNWESFRKFKALCKNQNFPNNTGIIDLSYFFIAMRAMVKAYMHILKAFEFCSDFYIGFEIINIAYSSTYIPSEKFIEMCKESGVPFNFESTIKRPINYDERTLENFKSSSMLESYDELENVVLDIDQKSFLLSLRALLPALIPLMGYNDLEALFEEVSILNLGLQPAPDG